MCRPPPVIRAAYLSNVDEALCERTVSRVCEHTGVEPPRSRAAVKVGFLVSILVRLVDTTRYVYYSPRAD